MEKFINFTDDLIDRLLNNSLIDTTQRSLVNISIENISTYQDYQKSKKVIESLIGAKDININKFNLDTIYYQLEVYGNLSSFIEEVSENSFFEIINIYDESSSLELGYKK